MEFNSTSQSVQPHHKITPDIWNQFVCEYPRCSIQFKLPDNQKDRYKFMSALMIANIFDTLTNQQQLQKLYNIYDTLGRIANDKDSPTLIQNYILNLMKPFNTLINNLQPFDFNQIDNKLLHEQKIQIVEEYLQKKRKYIYSFLDDESGINTLFQLSRGIALSLYLKPDYQVITPVSIFIKQSKEDIIKKLCSDDLEINQLNYFILEDYEVIAISHLLNFPIRFFINFFEKQSNYLLNKRIHQQQNQEKVIAFFLEIYQNNFTVRILSSNQDILYFSNIIIQQQKQFLQIGQNKDIVENIQQIIENILDQATQEFCNLNKFWIIKILQIIKLGEAQTLISNRKAIKINEQFSKESLKLFSLLKIDPKLHQQFVLNSEQNLKQREELIENIIISQVTMIRDQMTEIVTNQKKPQSLSQDHITNQISIQSKKKQGVAVRLIEKTLDNDLPENNDFLESDFTQHKIYTQQSTTNSKIIIQSSNDNNNSRKTRLHNKQLHFRSEIVNKKGSGNSQQSIQSQKKRQKSVDNSIFEASLCLQNDYLISHQGRRVQSDIYALKPTGKEIENLGFKPKTSIINQVNKQSNSQIIKKNVTPEQKVSEIEPLQSIISESLNESKSVIFTSSDWFCPICFTNINQPDLIRNLHDDHKVCLSCLEDWIKVKFNSGQWNFKFFQCPIQLIKGETMIPCEHIIDSQEIKNALTSEEFSKLAERAMKHGIIDINCPNQSCQASIKGMLPQNQNGLVCPECSLKICWVCKNSDHGESKCPQRLEEIKLALQDERVSCCPGCLEIYMKNDGCEHVSCTNCLVEFCFACSAHRPPIIAHGAHFHRAGCQYRVPWWKDQSKKIENLDEEYLPNECEYCKQNQKSCPRPMNLADFKNLAHLNF